MCVCVCVCVCVRERERGEEGGRLIETYIKQKGNLIPVEAWTGPEWSRRLKLPVSKTVVK